MAPKDSIGLELAVCAGGLVLMFVAHMLGLLAWSMTGDASVHVPYWWSYLILFPAATVLALRFTDRWLSAAACLCAPPIVYFLALGLLDGNWRASDGALWGAIAAFVASSLLARGMATRRRALPAGEHTSLR